MEEIVNLRQSMSALLRRAAVNEEFRQLCLEDAPAAYLAISGREFPEQYAVRFAEAGRENTVDDGIRRVLLPGYIPKTWLG
jgi:hypothetical protein